MLACTRHGHRPYAGSWPEEFFRFPTCAQQQGGVAEESVGKTAVSGFWILGRGRTSPFRGRCRQRALKSDWTATGPHLIDEVEACMIRFGQHRKMENPAGCTLR